MSCLQPVSSRLYRHKATTANGTGSHKHLVHQDVEDIQLAESPVVLSSASDLGESRKRMASSFLACECLKRRCPMKESGSVNPADLLSRPLMPPAGFILECNSTQSDSGTRPHWDPSLPGEATGVGCRSPASEVQNSSNSLFSDKTFQSALSSAVSERSASSVYSCVEPGNSAGSGCTQVSMPLSYLEAVRSERLIGSSSSVAETMTAWVSQICKSAAGGNTAYESDGSLYSPSTTSHSHVKIATKPSRLSNKGEVLAHLVRMDKRYHFPAVSRYYSYGMRPKPSLLRLARIRRQLIAETTGFLATRAIRGEVLFGTVCLLDRVLAAHADTKMREAADHGDIFADWKGSHPIPGFHGSEETLRELLCGSMFLASKMENAVHISHTDLCTFGKIDRNRLLDIEQYIVHLVDFRLNAPTAFDFLKAVVLPDEVSSKETCGKMFEEKRQLFQLSLYILELVLLEPTAAQYFVQTISSAALTIARYASRSSYPLDVTIEGEDLNCCIIHVLSILQEPMYRMETEDMSHFCDLFREAHEEIFTPERIQSLATAYSSIKSR